MDNEQIILKAIGIASKNGYDFSISPLFVRYIEDEEIFVYKNGDFYAHLYYIIFNHTFAKAFFGSEGTCGECGDKKTHQGYCHCDGYITLEAWQYHLQQMVLEIHPLQYIGKYLLKEVI